ncbi:MAG: bifunctional folylpolyglutamate synthase/dihydrofolate synthase [Chloroflexota bacterium]|nr:bifunctional folylpolyglutamate synthase/dihydrofolate synthase [Chloroflexota bacterium]
MTERIDTYADALRYLYSFADYERSAPRSLDSFRMRSVYALLEATGNPHQELRAIHIAGTKGKGSTAAMIGSILLKAGYTTGAYTSPHLNTHRERYRLDGEPVGEELFTSLLRDLQPAIERVRSEHSLTTFEVATVLAFELFRRCRVDWSIIEVGMGGRLDTTNVLWPQLCVITSISLDHTHVLGDTLEQIAGEKAGIIKRGVPVVVAPQRPEALHTIVQRAAEVGATAHSVADLITAGECAVLDRRWQELTLHTELRIHGEALEGRKIQLGLLGQHQVENALTSIVAGVQLAGAGAGLKAGDLVEGLRDVRWPGRFEVIEGPVSVVLDGAHNPDSVRKLRAAVREVFSSARTVWVFGALRGHDARGMLAELHGDPVRLCRSIHPRSVPVDELEATAREVGIAVSAGESVETTLRAALDSGGASVVVVCGSLSVVAEARTALGLAEATDPVTH